MLDAPALHIEHMVDDDAVEPGTEAAAALKGCEPGEYFDGDLPWRPPHPADGGACGGRCCKSTLDAGGSDLRAPGDLPSGRAAQGFDPRGRGSCRLAGY